MCCTKAKSALLLGANLPYWLNLSSLVNNELALTPNYKRLDDINVECGNVFNKTVCFRVRAAVKYRVWFYDG